MSAWRCCQDDAMENEQRPYFAYMVRLWCVSVNGEVVWRASLEDPHTGERHGFANLDRLSEFLWEQTQDINRSEEAGGHALVIEE